MRFGRVGFRPGFGWGRSGFGFRGGWGFRPGFSWGFGAPFLLGAVAGSAINPYYGYGYPYYY